MLGARQAEWCEEEAEWLVRKGTQEGSGVGGVRGYCFLVRLIKKEVIRFQLPLQA